MTAEDADDQDITPFDAANYTYQMTTELSRLARDGGLLALAGKLEEANALAAKAMFDMRRGRAEG